MSYNEADTRAKLIDRALHARQWIDLVKDEQRANYGEIHREQSVVRIDIPGRRRPARLGALLERLHEDCPQSLRWHVANRLDGTVGSGLRG